MKPMRILLGSLVAISLVTGVNVSLNSKGKCFLDITLSGIESLTSGDPGSNFGCGRAVYQWNDKNIFGHENFVKCQSGCPEGEGRDPQYMNC